MLCREVKVNLAYRWFCGLSIEDRLPDHSAFSRARNERFRDGDIYRRIFERIVEACIAAKIPRKGGPGITRSDLLVINKIDLAPYVGASLDVVERDARKMRGERPFLFTNLKENRGTAESRIFSRR